MFVMPSLTVHDASPTTSDAALNAIPIGGAAAHVQCATLARDSMMLQLYSRLSAAPARVSGDGAMTATCGPVQPRAISIGSPDVCSLTATHSNSLAGVRLAYVETAYCSRGSSESREVDSR